MSNLGKVGVVQVTRNRRYPPELKERAATLGHEFLA